MYHEKIAVLLLIASVSIACGDDIKKSGQSTNNTATNNTNNTATNNTNNTATNNTATNNTNNTSPVLDMGPDDMLLSEQSDEDAKAACRAKAAFDEAYSKAENCLLDGYYRARVAAETDEDLQVACAQVRDECLEEPFDDSRCEDAEPHESCDATVGELEVCYMAMPASQKAQLQGFTCETATLANEHASDRPATSKIAACLFVIISPQNPRAIPSGIAKRWSNKKI